MSVHNDAGPWFEDLHQGDLIEHAAARTITQTDNQWFTLLTQNTARIHLDAYYAAITDFGRPLVNSTLTLPLVTGQSVPELSRNVFANLGWDEIRLPRPVFEGDTIDSRSEVLETRASSSRPAVGIVTVRTEGLNQDDEIVISYKRPFVIHRRPNRSGLR